MVVPLWAWLFIILPVAAWNPETEHFCVRHPFLLLLFTLSQCGLVWSSVTPVDKCAIRFFFSWLFYFSGQLKRICSCKLKRWRWLHYLFAFLWFAACVDKLEEIDPTEVYTFDDFIAKDEKLEALIGDKLKANIIHACCKSHANYLNVLSIFSCM